LLRGRRCEETLREGWNRKRGPELPGPRYNFNYFFLAAFFFAAFFFAFFFAAIIVSFKVNLGIVQVRRLSRTYQRTIFRTTHSVFVVALPEKIRENHAWCANSMPQLKKNATLL
jgi:hypothetical protein